MPALRRWDVDLPQVFEAEQVADQAAIPHQGIQRRDECGRWRPHARLGGCLRDRLLRGEDVTRLAHLFDLDGEQRPILDESGQDAGTLRRLAGSKGDLAGHLGAQQPDTAISTEEPMARGVLLACAFPQQRLGYEALRSEERRVGKECRSGWAAYH